MQTLKVRQFWVLIPVVIALGLCFHFWWPQAGGLHTLLRGAVGTVVLLATASAVVLTSKTP